METPLLVVSSANRIDIQQSPLESEQENQKAFNAIKKIISLGTLLSYLNFNKPFDIHMGASNLQVGAVISQAENQLIFTEQN